jgi:hypothetical protein
MARKPARVRPVEAAAQRLLALVAKGVAPHRMAREVELIVAGWAEAPEAEPGLVREQLDALRELLLAGIADAEEQVADVDPGEAGAVKQAAATLAALVATRDATAEALAAL